MPLCSESQDGVLNETESQEILDCHWRAIFQQGYGQSIALKLKEISQKCTFKKIRYKVIIALLFGEESFRSGAHLKQVRVIVPRKKWAENLWVYNVRRSLLIKTLLNLLNFMILCNSRLCGHCSKSVDKGIIWRGIIKVLHLINSWLLKEGHWGWE